MRSVVHDQLAPQKIFFPPAGSPALLPGIKQYAGQQLTTGAQAKAYADHFIAVHIQEMTGGQTYAQLSGKALAAPNNEKLAGTVATVFKGETLRGLLLNAYAFGKMGQLMLYAALVSFVGAGIMLLLSVLGFMHLRRVDPDQEVFTGGSPKVAVPV